MQKSQTALSSKKVRARLIFYKKIPTDTCEQAAAGNRGLELSIMYFPDLLGSIRLVFLSQSAPSPLSLCNFSNRFFFSL